MMFFLFNFISYLGWKVPAAFSYSSTRMLLSALTALFATLLLGPYFIRRLYELKTGQSIRVEDCPMLAELHKKKKDTPTMGGIFILSAIMIAGLLWMDLSSSYAWILLATLVWLGGIGAYDDYLKLKHKTSKGLAPRKKLLAQIVFAALIAGYMVTFPGGSHAQELAPNVSIQSIPYYIPFYKEPIFQLAGAFVLISFFITIFVITGSSNAVNLTDGLDGLAAGCVMLVSAVFALVAFLSNNLEISRYLNILHIENSAEIGVFLSGAAGACLGFLWYNGYPAQVFMGDTGSLSLGGMLGVSAVLLRREVLLALVGGIFVAEALSVMIQVASYKWRNKKRVFLCSPLHHHFEYKGWPETKIVLRFWIVGLILAVIGVISFKVQ